MSDCIGKGIGCKVNIKLYFYVLVERSRRFFYVAFLVACVFGIVV